MDCTHSYFLTLWCRSCALGFDEMVLSKHEFTEVERKRARSWILLLILTPVFPHLLSEVSHTCSSHFLGGSVKVQIGNKSPSSLMKNKNGVQQPGDNTEIRLFCDANTGSKLSEKNVKGVYQCIEALYEENTHNCKTKIFSKCFQLGFKRKTELTLGSPRRKGTRGFPGAWWGLEAQVREPAVPVYEVLTC